MPKAKPWIETIVTKTKMALSMTTSSGEEAFQKVLRMTRFTGLLPLDDQCRLVPRTYLLSSCLLMVYTVGSTLHFFSVNDAFLINYSAFHKIIFYSRKVWMMLTFLLISYSYGTKRAQLESVLHNVKIVGDVLATMGLEWSCSLNPTKYFGTIAIIVSLYTYECYLVFSKANSILHWIPVYVDFSLAAIFVSQFCAFCYLMKHCLEVVLKTKNYTLYPKLYCLIEECCRDLNDVFGAPVLSLLTLNFVSVLHQLYQLFGLYNKPSVLTAYNSMLGLFFAMTILQIILGATEISAEMKKFSSFLYGELVKTNHQHLLLQDEFFFHFEQTPVFEMTACGYFSVNKSLFCSMILAWTTYLVILLQFSTSSFGSNA